MKQGSSHVAALVPGSLYKAQEIINKDIDVCEELGVKATKVRVPAQLWCLLVVRRYRYQHNRLRAVVQFMGPCGDLCAQDRVSQVRQCFGDHTEQGW